MPKTPGQKLTFRQALKMVKRAEEAAYEAMRLEYPVGDRFFIKRSQTVIRAKILMHGSGLQVKIRNMKTDKEYWIYASEILN